jgi:transcriptional regulator with XRE-family HTH domain
MPDIDLQHARAIGEKLRAVRQQRRMSLRKLAGKAGISASMLSRIEIGNAYPSVRSIYSIAAALDVPVDTFFPECETGINAISSLVSESAAGLITASEMREAALREVNDIAAMEPVFYTPASRQVVHPHMRPVITLKGGVSWSRLTITPEQDAEFLEITYEPGASSGANMSDHNGCEFGLVLERQLVVQLGFEHITLCAGDSIVFDSTTPHRLLNGGSEPMRALWVVLNRS